MPDVTNAALIAALLCACLAGVLLTCIRLPGTWVIVAAAAGFGWWDGWQKLTGLTLAILVGAAAAAEVVEMMMSVVVARRAGASRQAAWGGLLGGIAGMLLLTVPIPVVGTIVGAVVGCFAGAMLAELYVRREVAHGARVGFFSAIGLALGAAGKLAIALAMAGLVVASLLWSGKSSAAPSPPTAARDSRPSP
ncbi:MAG: DUF456 domain-containing protein [Planctomycetes bacterium]|nr:DUF456 domain-containing protein [Planctomycetota bacterium]